MSRIAFPSQAPPTGAAANAASGASERAVGIVAAMRPARLRRIPYAVTGALVVLAATAAVTTAFVQVGGRVRVLIVATPIAAGQSIGTASLRTASVAVGAGVDVIPAPRENSVVGMTAAVPLSPGEVLSSAMLGKKELLSPGQAEVAVALKPGSYPPGLAPGDTVQVLSTQVLPTAPRTASSGANQIVVRAATVSEVSAPDQQSTVVVAILTDQATGQRIATAAPWSLWVLRLPHGEGE